MCHPVPKQLTLCQPSVGPEMQDLLPEVLFGWQHLLSVWQTLAQERCDSQQALFVPEDENKHYLFNRTVRMLLFSNKETQVNLLWWLVHG